jgi:hypothetical protein
LTDLLGKMHWEIKAMTRNRAVGLIITFILLFGGALIVLFRPVAQEPSPRRRENQANSKN